MLLCRKHGWTFEDSFVSLNQSRNRPQIFVGHKLWQTNVRGCRIHFLLAPVEGLFFKPNIVFVLISLLLYFLSSLRRGDQSTVFCVVSINYHISSDCGPWWQTMWNWWMAYEITSEKIKIESLKTPQRETLRKFRSMAKMGFLFQPTGLRKLNLWVPRGQITKSTKRQNNFNVELRRRNRKANRSIIFHKDGDTSLWRSQKRFF